MWRSAGTIGLRNRAPFAKIILRIPDGLDGHLVGCFCKSEDRDTLRKLITDLSTMATARAQIAEIVVDFREPPAIQELKSLQEVQESLSALGLADITLARLTEILAAGESLQQAS
jgi:hypothetical protein